jgi:MFS family permease
MAAAPERLFTPRFFVMCGFTFTVFLSAFLLFPTAPFRILALGAGAFFLGFLTYASALSAPFTGALADRIGTRRVLATCGLVLTGFAAAYGWSADARTFLALPLLHGVFWSGLLSASSAYMSDVIPEGRRAEGLSYWGMSTVAAVAVAPSIGFWLYERGWGALCGAMAALNLVMALIALGLPAQSVSTPRTGGARGVSGLVEWRIVGLALSLFLCSFGYGGITSFSALYAESGGVSPKSIYLNTLALTILCTRPVFGRLADRLGHRNVFIPALLSMCAGLALLACSGRLPVLVVSAVIFGAGLGQAHPAFSAYVLRHVDARRRGAAFGAILAAFDTGIGTGSILIGLLVGRFGFRVAFGCAAALAALAVPYFLWSERRFLATSPAPPGGS